MDSASSHRSVPSRAAAPPPYHVVTDPSLFRHIVAFQSGIPIELYQFWTHHEPWPVRRVFSHDSVGRLVELVVKAGTPHHLDLIRSGRFLRDSRWHVPKFGWLARMAIQNQRVDLLEWMVQNDMHLAKPRGLWLSAIEKHSSDIGLRVLDLLQKACPLTEPDARAQIPVAISKPTTPFLRWIRAHYPSVVFPVGLIEAAVTDRDVEVLRVLLDLQPSRANYIAAFRTAYNSPVLDVLEFLIANCADTMADELKAKISIDKSSCIQEIVSRHPLVFARTYREGLLSAARAGDCRMMEDVLTRGSFNDADGVSIDTVSSWKGLTGLKFLHERGLARATTEAMDAAAEAKRWDVVEFLHTNRAEGCTTRAADAAVKSGNINCVRFFLENRHEGCSVAAMNHAAENGRMEILQYLHQHSKIGCTTEAMDVAASRGYIRVVRFLHENRTEGCTTDAMDGAARGGHLNVVQYLCENRFEGCTVAGVQGALNNHQLGIVQVLYERYPHLFGAGLLSDLLLHGSFDIFMKLRDVNPEEAGAIMETVMFEAGKQFELRTIRFIVNGLGRSDLLQFALEGAEAVKCEQWLGVVGSIRTFPAPPAVAAAPSSLLPDSMGHPFLCDARTPTWAVRAIMTEGCVEVDAFSRCLMPVQWHLRAVSRRDLTLLQVIRDLPPGTIQRCSGNRFDIHSEPFNFQGARVAAVRSGDQNILEWLLVNVDLPVEATLLDEAVYYHQFDIAEWLVATYPAACTELNWITRGNETGFQNFGLHDDLLDWLERHDAVRKALPLAGIIDYAARKNDVDSLTRLHEWNPELFTPRPALVELADLEECCDTINFLLGIGWSTDVFLEG